MQIQNQAQVIIGGGIMGCSIAYHLAKMGRTDVLLLEKDELTSGSTAHAAGLVTLFHSSPTTMLVRKYSINLYTQLKAEANGNLDWHPVGSLRVASSRGGYGYTIKSTVAYAYLPLKLAETGTKLVVEMFGERLPAEVVSSPLYDPDGHRLRATEVD